MGCGSSRAAGEQRQNAEPRRRNVDSAFQTANAAPHVETCVGSGRASSAAKATKTAAKGALRMLPTGFALPLVSAFVFAAVGDAHEVDAVVAAVQEIFAGSLVGVHAAHAAGFASGATGAVGGGGGGDNHVSLFVYAAKWDPSSEAARTGVALDFAVVPAVAEAGSVADALVDVLAARGRMVRDPDVLLVAGGGCAVAAEVAQAAAAVAPQVPVFGWSGAAGGGGAGGGGLANGVSGRAAGGDQVVSVGRADGDKVVVAALWTPGPLVFSGASGYAASPFAGMCTRVSGSTVVEIDRKPAAAVVLRWLFGSKAEHDASALVELGPAIPLGVHVRFDDEGDEQFNLVTITGLDAAGTGLVVSAPLPRGARITFLHSSPSDVVAALHKKGRSVLRREFLSPVMANGALAGALTVVPAAHFAARARGPDLGVSADKLGAADASVDGRATSAWVLAEQQVGTYATGEAGVGTLFSPSMYVVRGRGATHDGVAGIVQPGSGNIVYTDIQDSTVLWLADEAEMARALAVHDAVIRKVIATYRGTELKTQGDAFLIFFRTLHDAVRCCVAMQDALLDAKWPKAIFDHDAASVERDEDGTTIFRGLRVRMGLHHIADELVYTLNARSGVVEPVGPVVAAGSTVADCGDGGQTLVAALVAPVVAMGVKRKLLPKITLTPAGNVVAGGTNVNCVSLAAGAAALRSFRPLRARKGVGHWTHVGRNVALDRNGGANSRSLLSAGDSLSSRGSLVSPLGSIASPRAGVVGPADGDDLVVFRDGRDDFHIATAAVAGEASARKAVAKAVAKLKSSFRFAGFTSPPHALFVYFTDNMSAGDILAGLRGYAPHAAIIGCTAAYAAFTEDGWFGTPGVDGPSLGVLAIHDANGAYMASRIEIDGSDPQASAAALGEAIKERCADSAEGLPVAHWMMAPAGNEEDLLRGLLSAFGDNLVLAGGSSGVVTLDAPGHQITGDPETGDVVTKNALTLLSMYPSCSVQLSFGHGYRPTPKVGVVTKAEGRVIVEIDGRPAAQVYNEWCGGEIDAWVDDGGKAAGGDNLIFACCARLALGREVTVDVDGDPVYALSHAVAVVPDAGAKGGDGVARVSAAGISWITEFVEGERVRLCVATDHARANRMSVMLRQHMQSPVMRACEVHGHVIAACVSLPMTIGERMAEYSSGFAAALEHTPMLGGWTYGEQGTFANGRLQHSNIMLSAMSFVSAKAAGIESVLAADGAIDAQMASAPTGFVAVLFLSIDDFERLQAKKAAVAKRAMSAVLALAEAELERLPSAAYLVKSDKTAGTAMVAFSSVESALAFALAFQTAAMGIKWADELLAKKRFAPAKASDGTVLFRGPRIRMGLNAGEPVIRFNLAGRIDYFGPVVNLAARLTAHAPPGTVAAARPAAKRATAAASDAAATRTVRAAAVRGVADPVDIIIAAPLSLAERLDGHASAAAAPKPATARLPALPGKRTRAESRPRIDDSTSVSDVRSGRTRSGSSGRRTGSRRRSELNTSMSSASRAGGTDRRRGRGRRV